MSAARTLVPNSSPSQAPVAIATTFLTAPPTCSPMGSALSRVRNIGACSSGWSFRAALMSLEATTTSVGKPRATSRAKLGPERNASRSAPTAGMVSASTSDMSLSVRSSIPLVATTTSASRGRTCAMAAETERRCWEGVHRRVVEHHHLVDERGPVLADYLDVELPGELRALGPGLDAHQARAGVDRRAGADRAHEAELVRAVVGRVPVAGELPAGASVQAG